MDCAVQAHTVREHIRQAGLKVDLVITSPLTRALETAVGVFGEHQCPLQSEIQTPGMCHDPLRQLMQ